MKLIVIFGPGAVGKMTVGFELQKLTGLRLFHNHMTIEPLLNIFKHGTPQFNLLSAEFRRRVMEEVATSDLPGMIFTFVWALNLPKEKTYIDNLTAIFEREGADVHFVELYAEQAERIQRNKTPLRLENKASKRDIAFSERILVEQDAEYQLNSDGDFFYPDQHLRIDNTHLSAAEVAQIIVEKLDLDTLNNG